MSTINMISQIHQLLRVLGFTSKCAMFLIDDVFYKQVSRNKFCIFLKQVVRNRLIIISSLI